MRVQPPGPTNARQIQLPFHATRRPPCGDAKVRCTVVVAVVCQAIRCDIADWSACAILRRGGVNDVERPVVDESTLVAGRGRSPDKGGREVVVKCTGIVALRMAFGLSVALLAVAASCQPGSPGATRQPTGSINAQKASDKEAHLPHAEPNIERADAPTAEDVAANGSNARHSTKVSEADSPTLMATKSASAELSPQQHYEVGLSAEQAGDTDDAIAHYTAALELDPDFAQARKKLGALLVQRNRFIDASILYGQQVEREPNSPDAHNDWGVILVRVGSLQEAILQFREALKLKADHPDAHYNLAVALLTSGKVTEAMEHLVEALRIHPSYTDAYFTLGRAYLQQGKLDEAVAQFRRVMQLDREYKGLDYELGRAFVRKDDLKKAVQHFSEAVRRDPFSFKARYAMGLALAKYGNQPGATAQFTEAVRLEPESPDAHVQLALALARIGRTEEAIVHNDTALSLRPDWPEALNNQAWLLATASDERLRNPKRALELATRAKELADYKMPMVLDTLAAAQAASGEFDHAQQNAAKASEWAAATDQAQMAGEIEQRLNEYRAKRPYREPTAAD
jgi:tetratricopeptide (TPR) repeat protein